MRAARVTRLDGPTAIEVLDLPEPTAGPNDVLIDVHRVGISFPDLLLSKGQYQLKPELPFTLGVDLAGTWSSRTPTASPPGTGWPPCSARRRCRAAAVPAIFTFPLPDALSYDDGRGAADELPHRAVRAGRARRAACRRDRAGARRGRRRRHRHPPGRQGPRRPDHRGRLHRGQGRDRPAAGADEVVLLDGFKDAVERAHRRPGRRRGDGRGRRRRLHRLAALPRRRRAGCWWSASPAARASPRSRSTGCCSTTSTSAGSAGAPTRWSARLTWASSGGAPAADGRRGVHPPIGATYDLDQIGQALVDMDERRTLGKSVIRLR